MNDISKFPIMDKIFAVNTRGMYENGEKVISGRFSTSKADLWSQSGAAGEDVATYYHENIVAKMITHCILQRMPMVYLAGPITGEPYARTLRWRQVVQHQLREKAICINPLRDHPQLHGMEKMQSPEETDNPMLTGPGYTARDLYDIRRADIVLCNLFFSADKQISRGSLVELGYARGLGKIIVLVMRDGDAHDCAMVRGMADYVVPGLSKAVEVIASLAGTFGDHSNG
jgi:nucleoside 2-deoxyribosyltransferase